MFYILALIDTLSPVFSGLGQKAVTPDSLAVIQDLLERASAAEADGGSLTIMPGSGINADTIHDVLSTLLPHGLREVHLSAGTWVPSAMRFRRPDMGMGVGGAGEWGIWRTRESIVRAVRTAIDDVVGTPVGSEETSAEEPAASEVQAEVEGEEETEADAEGDAEGEEERNEEDADDV
jgi:hypothetical protein